MPQINRIIDSPFAHGELSLRTRHRVARELARGGYQRAYVLPNSLKSALIPVPCRHPRTHRFRRRNPLRTDQPPPHAGQEAAAADGRALRPARRSARGAAATTAAAATPARQPGAAHRDAGSARESACPKLAVFCPGAEYGPAKRWPARHFAALAAALAAARLRRLAARLGQGQAGRRGDRRPCQPRQPAAQSVRHDDSLAQAIDLLGAASLVVCNDSGLMHVAAALGRRWSRFMARRRPASRRPSRNRRRSSASISPAAPASNASARSATSTACNKLEPQRVLAACLGGAAA
jgi:heptosyltransferase-2